MSESSTSEQPGSAVQVQADVRHPSGQWIDYSASTPIKPGLYHTRSEYDEPELTHWNGDAWDYMDGHTNAIVKWWKPNTSLHHRETSQ